MVVSPETSLCIGASNSSVMQKLAEEIIYRHARIGLNALQFALVEHFRAQNAEIDQISVIAGVEEPAVLVDTHFFVPDAKHSG